MSVNVVKELAFRHCEKAILVAVIAFVGLNIYGYMNGDGGQGGGIGVPGGGGSANIPEPSIPAHLPKATVTFHSVPSVANPPYDPYWPPSTRDLKPIALQMGKKETAQVSLQGKIVGQPERKDLDREDRERLPRVDYPSDCGVEVAVGGEATSLTLTAKTPGRWVKFVGRLEDGDRYNLFVCVRPRDAVTEEIVLPPKNVKIEEVQFGVVEITFEAPERREPKKEGNVTTIYLAPKHFEILRKGPEDEEPRLIGRVLPTGEGKREGGDRPSGRPAGVPRGLPPGGAPPPPGRVKRQPRTTPGALPTGLSFTDTAVESEAEYAYSVRSVAENSEGEPAQSEAVNLTVTTKARFTFIYVGGSSRKSRIIVVIGPRDESQGARLYEVPVGGRVGELPKVLEHEPAESTETRESKPPAGPADKEKALDQRFVTRFVLIDVQSNAYKMIEQIRHVRKPKIGGGFEIVKEKSYWSIFSRYVLLRNAKNQLIRVWVEPVPRDLQFADVSKD